MEASIRAWVHARMPTADTGGRWSLHPARCAGNSVKLLMSASVKNLASALNSDMSATAQEPSARAV